MVLHLKHTEVKILKRSRRVGRCLPGSLCYLSSSLNLSSLEPVQYCIYSIQTTIKIYTFTFVIHCYSLSLAKISFQMSIQVQNSIIRVRIQASAFCAHAFYCLFGKTIMRRRINLLQYLAMFLLVVAPPQGPSTTKNVIELNCLESLSKLKKQIQDHLEAQEVRQSESEL